MQHCRLVPPLQALYDVFVLPTLQQVPRHITRHSSIKQHSRSLRLTCTAGPCNATVLSKRYLHTTVPRKAKSRPPEQRTQLWNEEIPARRVVLVDEQTKSLLPPRTRFDVLNSIDHKTHRLICVSPPPGPAYDARRDGEWTPTCKIVSKKDEYQASKEKRAQKKQAQKSNADSVKTLELNWAIDGNDLGHRVKRIREFLEAGKKVEIVLAKKKSGRVASEEECRDVLKKIKEAVEEVKGAKETKELEGKVGGVATMLLEGPKA